MYSSGNFSRRIPKKFVRGGRSPGYDDLFPVPGREARRRFFYLSPLPRTQGESMVTDRMEGKPARSYGTL